VFFEELLCQPLDCIFAALEGVGFGTAFVGGRVAAAAAIRRACGSPMVGNAPSVSFCDRPLTR
jgi:hypothetical protein